MLIGTHVSFGRGFYIVVGTERYKRYDRFSSIDVGELYLFSS